MKNEFNEETNLCRLSVGSNETCFFLVRMDHSRPGPVLQGINSLHLLMNTHRKATEVGYLAYSRKLEYKEW